MEHPSLDPPCAATLHQLRTANGLSVDQVAASIGLNKNSARDLESYDDELYPNVSLAVIQRLALLLKTTVSQLLLLEPDAKRGAQVTFNAVVRRLGEHLQTTGQSADSFGDQIGWDIASTLSDPAEIWAWSPDELRNVATGLGVDWVGALPSLTDVPPPIQAGA